MLDNLEDTVRPASQRTDLIPVYSFNDEEVWVEMRGRSGSPHADPQLERADRAPGAGAAHVKLPRRPQPLGRQVAWVVSAIFLFALVGVQAIHLRSAQRHLQRQLESLAQDAATSIGLSLGVLLRGGDAALAETVINPAFDRGHYERIEYLGASGERLVEPPPAARRRAAIRTGSRALFALHAPTAESLVSARLAPARQGAGDGASALRLRAAVGHRARHADLPAAHLRRRAASRCACSCAACCGRWPRWSGAAQAIAARSFVTLRLRPATRELARVVEAMNTLSRKVSEAIEARDARAPSGCRTRPTATRSPACSTRAASPRASRASTRASTQPFAGVLAFVELAELAAINRGLGHRALRRAAARGLRRDAGGRRAPAGGFAGRWAGALTVLALPGLGFDAAREALAALRARVARRAEASSAWRAHDKVSCGGVEARGGAGAAAPPGARRPRPRCAGARGADGVVVLRAAPPAMRPAKPAELLELVSEALAGQARRPGGAGRLPAERPPALHTEIMARLRDAVGTRAGRRRVPAGRRRAGARRAARSGGDRASVLEARAQRRRAAISVNVSIRSIEADAFIGVAVEQMLRRDRGARRAPGLRAVRARRDAERGRRGGVRARGRRGRGALRASTTSASAATASALAQRLRPAYIKLAGATPPRMVSNSGARFYAESLVRAARQLDIPVIAQNVEDEAHVPRHRRPSASPATRATSAAGRPPGRRKV